MATLTFKQFSEVYDLCSRMLSFDVLLPAVKEGAYHDAVLRLGIRGDVSSGRAATWQEIADYQKFQLKMYLKNFWQDMLTENGRDDELQDFWPFMCDNPELILFMGKELFAFMLAARQKFYRMDEECVLMSKEAAKILESYSFDDDLHRCFAALMVVKLEYFGDSLAFSTDYQIFLKWMPQWQEKYPDVWEAISVRLSELKEAGLVRLRILEHQRLYAAYCSES